MHLVHRAPITVVVELEVSIGGGRVPFAQAQKLLILRIRALKQQRRRRSSHGTRRAFSIPGANLRLGAELGILLAGSELSNVCIEEVTGFKVDTIQVAFQLVLRLNDIVVHHKFFDVTVLLQVAVGHEGLVHLAVDRFEVS